MRYLIRCSFDGSRFAGWQRQLNALTVQEEIQNALKLFLRQEVPIVGCGRTDAGVHASTFYFHMELESAVLEEDSIMYKLNQILPADIVLHEIERRDGLHARFDAVSRSYTYFIHTSPSPFKHRYSFFYPSVRLIHPEKLNDVASMIMNYREFDTFCKTHSEVKTTICDITRSSWELNGDELTYHITSNRFLRGMVRLIVGAMLNVASGKMPVGEVESALIQKRKTAPSWSVPAHGLFLTDVRYPSNYTATEASS